MGERFAWLDGARGAAAGAVMLYHFEAYLGFAPLFRSSYLAVDLFFIMSGFVLAHSYGFRIMSGRMAFGSFLLARLVRLWPLYILATIVGIGSYLAEVVLGASGAPALTDIAAFASLNLAFLPGFIPSEKLVDLFPFVTVSWSLSTEMMASIAFGLLLVRLGDRALVAAFLILTAVFLGYVHHLESVNMGWMPRNYAGGIFRTLSEFTLGMLLYRWYARRSESAMGRALALWIAVPLAVATLLLMPRDWPVVAPLAAVFLVFPLALLAGARRPASGRLEQACEELGRLSYPLYLLHMPVMVWSVGIAKVIDPRGREMIGAPGLPGAALSALLVVLAVSVSYAAARLFDEPVRERVTRALRARRTGAGPSQAVGSA